MQLKGTRPGRFGPRCQKCSERFVLVVPDDPNQPPIAKPVTREKISPAVALALGIDLPPPRARVSTSQRAPVSAPVSAAAVEATVPPPAVAVAVEATAPPAAVAAAPIDQPEALDEPVVAAPAIEAAPPPAGMTSQSVADAIREAQEAMDEADDGVHAQEKSAPSDSSDSSVIGQTIAPPAPAPAAPKPAAPPRAPAAAASPEIEAEPQLEDPALRELEAHGKLGGYELLQKLGQGGMGSVYLARQVSLDRNVAVKILAPQLGRDPTFVARFTREAYAAAQLTHHNIVQIHDIGEEKDIRYFSMEFVPGQTLGGMVKHSGRLEPEAAVGYVLQAARGLKFAHEHAMIHRDIKPENLLLNDQGMVKVADLGLVKRKGSSDETASPGMAAAADASKTQANLMMGTPAYMAPEQAKDAARVDVRADIYSLGCTLYDLLTGRPPFVGKTAVEVLTKHASEPVVPPEMIVKNVPKLLSGILLKMVAKKPEERHATMADVIKDLEEYLGTSSGGKGPFTPKEEHARALESTLRQFNSANWAMLRRIIIWTYLGLCAGLTVLLVGLACTGGNAAGDIKWAGAIFGLAVLSIASYLVLTGITQRTHLFRKIRQYMFGAKLVDWLKVALALIVLTGILAVLNMLWIWLGVLVAAVVVTAAFHFSVDTLVRQQRKVPLAQAEGLFKVMRMRGLDEEALRQFVCKYSGHRWEEFYETLFGYEAKMHARQQWGRDRKKWGAWRDPTIAWIDQQMRHRQEEKERRFLAKVEERKLRAQGVAQPAAKARKLANAVVAKASRMRETIKDASRARRGATVGEVTVVTPASLLDDDSLSKEEGFERRHESYIQRKYGSFMGLLLGAQVRFLVGLGVLCGFLVWFHTANPDFPSNVFHAARQVVGGAHDTLSGEDRFQNEPAGKIDVQFNTPDKPLTADPGQEIGFAQQHGLNVSADAQAKITSTTNKILAIIGSYEGGLAGAILVLSGLFRGLKMGIYMTIAVSLILLCGGPDRLIQIPTFGRPWDPNHVSMIAGSAIAGLAFMFGRER
jgi:serine/threonine protein kinase